MQTSNASPLGATANSGPANGLADRETIADKLNTFGAGDL